MLILSGVVCVLTAVTYADNDVFGDDLIDINTEDINKHVASSVENLGELLCSEQKLLDSLIDFKIWLEKENDLSKDKSVKNMVNIITKLEKYKLFEKSSREKCLKHVSNPIHSFLLLKRTTKIWTQKLKHLKVNLKSCQNKELINIHFPSKGVNSFCIPEEVDYAEVIFDGYKVQYFYSYSGRGCGLDQPCDRVQHECFGYCGWKYYYQRQNSFYKFNFDCH